eukprot:GHVR01191583.1.p1 GENE.GHVR01191583.1~~GHVR01191583.1.p1  ORF type:complete len:391 (+),score=44.03 GHVR01191583.1:57-1229(+)
MYLVVLLQLFFCIVAGYLSNCRILEKSCEFGSYSFVRKVKCKWRDSSMKGNYALKVPRLGETGKNSFLKELEITKELHKVENMTIPKGPFKCTELIMGIFEQPCLFSERIEINDDEEMKQMSNDLFEVKYRGTDESICLLSTHASEGNFDEFRRKRDYVDRDIETFYIEWMTQMANALKVLESKNIIHRDVTPSNMLINSVKSDVYDMYLSDFGLAVKTEDIAKGDQLKDNWPENHAYFTAPEVTEYYWGESDIKPDSKADVFQLGLSFIVISYANHYWYEYPTPEDLKKYERSYKIYADPIQKKIFYWAAINDVREKLLGGKSIPSVFINGRYGFYDKAIHIYDGIISLLHQMTEPNPNYRPSIDEVLSTLNQLKLWKKEDYGEELWRR